MTKGERIRSLREKAKMTQEELAKKLQTTKQTIHKYEKNIVTNIPSDRIEELAKVLNATPEYILGWDAAKSSTSKKIDVTTDILKRMETDKSFSEAIQMLYQMTSEEITMAKNIINEIKQFSSTEHK